MRFRFLPRAFFLSRWPVIQGRNELNEVSRCRAFRLFPRRRRKQRCLQSPASCRAAAADSRQRCDAIKTRLYIPRRRIVTQTSVRDTERASDPIISSHINQYALRLRQSNNDNSSDRVFLVWNKSNNFIFRILRRIIIFSSFFLRQYLENGTRWLHIVFIKLE